MNKTIIISLCLLTVLAPVVGAQTIDFDELVLAEDSFFDGYGADAVAGSWATQDVTFNTNTFGPGWSYSNVNDVTTPGFQNQWAAFAGTDVSGDGNYALANSFSDNGAFINLPVGRRPESIALTNTTFAAISMRDGDSFATPFGGDSGNDPDFFRVTFSGFSDHNTQGFQTGSVEFFLADYRFQDNDLDFILSQWETISLLDLGNARSIGISFDGSDVGPFGLNTPAYVAIDNLQLQAVPEPIAGFPFGCCLVVAVARRSGR